MFTKDYIELCKNEKIQELRPELEEYVDWYELHGYVFLLICEYGSRQKVNWLPLSHQLDEEIIKICKEKYPKNVDYVVRCSQEYFTAGLYGLVDKNDYLSITYNDTNPLIAKIKLLIQLLQQEAK